MDENSKKEVVLRRKARRRMAWIGLWSLIVMKYVLFFLVPEKRIPLLENFVDMYVICMTSIVLGYLGVATWDDLNQMKHRLSLSGKKEEPEAEEGETTPKK